MKMSQLSLEMETVCSWNLLWKHFFSQCSQQKQGVYGIPPEPDLWVVLKEENVKEDKDRPKVSTFWKYGVVFNLVREVCIVALVLPYCFSNKLSYLGMKVASLFCLLNPFTPKISVFILLTISSTIGMVLVWRIWFWIN